MFEFTITAQDGKARTGELKTPHGTVRTPVFMPVGTHGAVKGVSPDELKAVGSQIILGNTYHLYLRPGDGLIRDLGGLQAITGWNAPTLTDSGGFQVFSLGERGMAGQPKKALRSVSEEGITFRSHLDGSSHLFTPEKSIEIQQNLGADIIMAFDQPVYGLSDLQDAETAMLRTQRWLVRSREQWKRGEGDRQALFGIVQGGIHTELHRQSAEFTAGLDLPGNAIGGLSVGEGKPEMWAATDSITDILPKEKPRYFMGLGEPLDLIEATIRGVDMYDCVSPSRLARHGAVWSLEGEGGALKAFWEGRTENFLDAGGPVRVIRLNLHNASFRTVNDPLLKYAPPAMESLLSFSQATLRHYVQESEMLGFRILTLYNIHFLNMVVRHAAAAIGLGRIGQLREAFLDK